MTIDMTFDPATIETKWFEHWETSGAFRPDRPDAQPFTIVNPPPNVTGSLHIGHALDNTLQDILIRHARLQGKDALWVVGMDHAGIATQMVVELQLEERQDKRTNYSRDEFVDIVWKWKAESGGQITRQLRRLGCSMDWANEQFTMDPHFNRAVLKVFVDLYNQGLIYRDKRLVNWDPKLKTAISDLEVETREVKGGFWRFRYPFADDSGHVEVATTRPETMLADMAVAVHPEDARYKDAIGKEILQPITGRRFEVVADEHADPELGSGVVKITPGHDFNDFEVGKRAGIKPSEMLKMFDAEARVVQTSDGLIPGKYLGLDRFVVRDMIVADMKAAGFLIPHVTKDAEGEAVEHDFEPRTIQTPFGDRGGVVIEPWLTDQWYVDAETLAQPPMQAVRDGRIEIVPKSWEKTFFNWMENIQPWCVSLQLWWGHRIPAWYDADGKVYVAEDEAAAQVLAGEGVALTQDNDVLDTWFSSALWPFATLGWPDENPSPLAGEGGERSEPGEEVPDFTPSPSAAGAAPPSPARGEGLLARHYPNDVLISGFDILFFWDARMAMQGMHFMKEVPWKTLYLHGLVRAADGQKMSKSKGNVVDPLILMDKYGADALRFFMAAMESQGRDVKMDERRVEGYRNFATKLWNAARFCQSNGIGASTTLRAPEANLAVNKWIIGEVVETLAKLDKAFAEFRFDAMADAIYQFSWGTFCDWYLELIKPAFVDGEKQEMDEESKTVAGWVLDQILVMLHPFMPFITEELWHAMGERQYDLIVAKWPEPKAKVDAVAKHEVDWLIDLISEIRSVRTELNVPVASKVDLVGWADLSLQSQQRLKRNEPTIERLGRIREIRQTNSELTGGVAQIVVEGETYVLPLEGIIDLDAERTRISKAIEAASKEAKSLEGRLSNPAFVEKAKPEAVEKARADHAEKAAEVERLSAALTRLG
ncbi:MAG: valine--tRNA ligase [Sphingorhabdus sp.]|uniref:valine--tRNA ligase n=1 Tax=Sphingorhabdus sp. TaxID=1902408 RepID=UPI003CA8DA4B